MQDDRLPVETLRILEKQVLAAVAAADGTVPFLRDGMLLVIRAAIAAEEELARLDRRR